MGIRTGQMSLAVSVQGAGFYPRSWRHPGAEPDRLLDPAYYYTLAQTAERGKLDLLFLDHTAITDGLRAAGREPGLPLEPFTLLGAIASVTSHIGLGAAASTNAIEPFAVARQLAALDHLSGGRLAWVASIADETEPRRLRGGPPELAWTEKLARRREFVDVAERLWDSWEDGAVIVDRASGRYIDAGKVHLIDFAGDYFRVRGPLSLPRPPQGYPVRIGVYGDEEEAAVTGADAAELVFASAGSAEQAADLYKRLKSGIAAKGRAPDSVKVLMNVTPILGSTKEEARRRAAELAECAAESQEGVIAALPDPHVFVGTPEGLAERMEEWYRAYGSDGFHVKPALLPAGIEELVDEVVPILQRKGLFRTDYEDGVLRSRLGLPDVPARQRDIEEARR
ncbi:LLM class flavin-dependent oxidoreductase [Paenibacillus ginsengarvi]|uniref:LLM class flavin-dependent oxidoreductase n=1 Tax=Paenibacillus ginsengarvi TaxID=400777 RepID=A0A3B0C805_9BACL|nr:LLM class flavin-dependent oxidoreductase [Paenibacillus ginsengarvi]RKN80489.1 LLM class flavin-dependent oxidoreductase [Paenibacillus ginsengarvi]